MAGEISRVNTGGPATPSNYGSEIQPVQPEALHEPQAGLIKGGKKDSVAKLALSQKIAKVAKQSFEAVSNAYKSGTAVMIHDFVSNVADATKNIHQNATLSQVLGESGKALSIASAPLAVQGMYKGFNRVFTKMDASNRIDGALAVIKSVGSLSKLSVKVAKVVHSFGWITSEALKWTAAVTVFGTALSAAGLISVIKNWVQAEDFQRRVGLHKKPKDYAKAIDEMLANKGNGLKRHLQISRKDLHPKIDAIRKKAEAEGKKTEDINKFIFKALKGRVQNKILSHRLAFLATTIGLVTGIILLATPAAPLMYAALAIGSFITINKFLVDKSSDKQFKRFLNVN